MSDTQLQLRWHSHSATFTGMLHELHLGRAYTDVSLVCDGGVVRAHRAVLSLCSPYLAVVLGACPGSDDPLLLPEIPVQDIRYLITFIYRGQVDVPQQHIGSFLSTAKHLRVLGLEQGDRLVDSPCKSEDNSSVSSNGTSEHTGISNSIENHNNNNVEKSEEDDDDDEESMEIKPNLLDSIKQEIITADEKDCCDVTADGRIDLNFYLQQAIQSASMPCPLCKKEFKSQSGLRDHIRLHTGERPFECDFCQMNFARASHLKRHRRMHTGEKPFDCKICGKVFARGDKLKDHLRRHEAEDRLHQIRKQVYQLDEGCSEETNHVTNQMKKTTTNQVSGYPQINQVSMPSVNSTMATPGPVLSQKTLNSSADYTLMPPFKRRRGRPPKSAVTSTTYQPQIISNPVVLTSGVSTHPALQPAASVVPSSISSPGDGLMSPQVLGVASIGECILSPIN